MRYTLVVAGGARNNTGGIMKIQYNAITKSILLFSLLLSGCSSGQLFESTVTPTPTPTLAATATEIITIAPIITATAFIIPTPSIPLYDSFDNAQPDLNKWNAPSWGNPKPYKPVQSGGVLKLDFDTDSSGSWRDWRITPGHRIQEMDALVTLGNGGIGISLRSGSQRYDLYIYTSGGTVVYDGKSKSDTYPSPIGGCCKYHHLLGAESDGTKISFFIDGKLLDSYPMSRYPDYAGLQVSGSNHIIASVEDVWVKLTP